MPSFSGQQDQATMHDIGLESLLEFKAQQINKTKVVCTLGPVSRDVDILCKLLQAGMTVARFNFSHGTHDYHQGTLDNLRIAMSRTQKLCAVMLDTKGPEIRTGTLTESKITYKTGTIITVTTKYETKGDANTIAVSYPYLARDLKPGRQILVADGSLVLECVETNEEQGYVKAKAINTAAIGERKNVNLPGVVVDLPTLTKKDEEDISNWGIKNEIDMIAASFVRKPQDVINVKKVLGDYAPNVQIISKIENQEGLDNFDDILQVTEGIMVARGDLGMEIPTEKIFLAQKIMIQKCNQIGKPVIVATQMLESMGKNPKPTRAEATDVANAVMDGTDAVMLSGETAAGSYPLEAVEFMVRVCKETEAKLDYNQQFNQMMSMAKYPMTPLESLASTAVRTAHKVSASLIVVLTRGGSTARLVAKYRPPIPVLTVIVPIINTKQDESVNISPESPACHALVTRGLLPIFAEGSAARANPGDTTDIILNDALKQARALGYCKTGDSIIALHRMGPAAVIKIVIVK